MNVLRLSLILLAGILAEPAAAQKLGPGNPSCYEIRNTVPFTILTHVILPSRERSVARVESNRAERHCIAGELFPDGQVNFRIVSGLGPPLFSCMTKIDQPIVVSATRKADGGWLYEANCQ
jgi:hypothetical protein